VTKKCVGRLLKAESKTVAMIKTITVRCDKCQFHFNMRSAQKGVCENVAYAIPSAGTTFEQMNKFFSLLNIKIMDDETFIDKKRMFDSLWKAKLEAVMSKNAAAERKLAIERGWYVNGVPATRVKLDAGYGTKSNGRYNSRSCTVSLLISHVSCLCLSHFLSTLSFSPSPISISYLLSPSLAFFLSSLLCLEQKLIC
jgi:hypothetical protein